MNIFLLGHKGYLGSYLARHLEVDIVLQDKKYDYFINCASKTSLEYCEKYPLKSKASNLDVLHETHKLIPESKIITFSSYYVYNNKGFCSEEAITTDRYQYAKHKLLAEAYAAEQGGVVFRLGKLFGHDDIYKQNRLTEHIIKMDDLVLDEVYFNPTSLSQVLGAVRYELQNNNLKGLFNLANEGFTTHYRYGQFINSLLGSKKKVIKVKKIHKTFDNYGKFLMSCDKVKQYIKLNDWREDIRIYINNLKENE